MQTTQVILELIRFIPIIIILIYAALSDHKTSHVQNQAWKYAPAGLILTILTIIFYPNLLTTTLISIALTTLLSLLLFYLRMWGGADAKALILIALSTPLTPLWHTPITYLPLVTLAIAGLIAIAYTIIKHPKNFLKAKVRYIPFLLTGYIITILVF